jgi:hypothetical protein
VTEFTKVGMPIATHARATFNLVDSVS